MSCSNLVIIMTQRHEADCQASRMTAGDEEELVDELECGDVGTNGEESPHPLVRADLSGSSAHFWEGLLKDKHQQLLEEDEQQVRQQWHSNPLHRAHASPPLDPAGAPPHQHPSLLHFTRSMHAAASTCLASILSAPLSFSDCQP